MVEFASTHLDLAFGALADPSRRAILERLSREADLSVSELAEPFSVSLPAVIKHLDVLERAGLVERNKTGRIVRCRLSAAPMETAMQWLARYERFWTRKLDVLAAFVEETECPKPASQASRSGASLKRPRKQSSMPGRSRKR